jgi:hypothetical protein
MISKPEILAPLFVLALWTFAVLNVVGFSRIRAGVRGVVKPADFRLGESENVPERVKLANRNYMNLLELPVLFYAVCVIIYVTGSTSGASLFLAWLYVGLRVLHSCIHLTYNNVMHRLYAFAASNTVLFVLWVVAAIAAGRGIGA